jgi:hypothetical protein
VAYKTRSEWQNVPNDQRCEVLCRPTPRAWQLWKRTAYRCHRPAEQSRDGHAVCWQHARTEGNVYLERVT